MFFLNWFFRKSAHPRTAVTGSVLLRPAQPFTHENQKQEGQAQANGQAPRERLYEAIRESMTRVGRLASTYKFKVLALDSFNQNFIVMVDLSIIAGEAVPLPSEMEALIVETAKLRYAISVLAVYWRLNEVGGKSSKPIRFIGTSQSSRKKEAPYEPIQADEVAAFQQALRAASENGSAAGPVTHSNSRQGLRSSNHSSDFGDTEASEAVPSSVLSSTQYGELR
ncbi:MAG: hypothetical protein JWR68_2054 [Polaromonas sp.]|nr:hypothetical protein [Polaromonas sp.]